MDEGELNRRDFLAAVALAACPLVAGAAERRTTLAEYVVEIQRRRIKTTKWILRYRRVVLYPIDSSIADPIEINDVNKSCPFLTGQRVHVDRRRSAEAQWIKQEIHIFASQCERCSSGRTAGRLLCEDWGSVIHTVEWLAD